MKIRKVYQFKIGFITMKTRSNLKKSYQDYKDDAERNNYKAYSYGHIAGVIDANMRFRQQVASFDGINLDVVIECLIVE